jgi:hypothetical protein
MWRTTTAGLAIAAMLVACAGGGDDATIADTASDGGGPIAGASDLDTDGAAGETVEEPAAHAAADVEAESAAAGDVGTRSADDARPVDAGIPLRAGSVDDNLDFVDYLDYRARFLATGIPVHDLDVSERHIVEVRTPDGRPVLGATVTLRAGDEELARVRTTADGAARVFPLAVGAAPDQDLELEIAHGTARVAQPLERTPGVVPVTLDTDVVGSPVPLDILLLLDTTGSMGDELQRLTATFADVARQVRDLETPTDLRFGYTAYRDLDDEYVTRTSDFTADVDAFVDDLGGLRAEGGGDTPEALSEALEEALAAPSWRDGDTVSLVFLVADAPPQLDREADYAVEVIRAAAQGIKIVPLASSGLDNQGEYVFRQLAQITGAPFLFLTYGADGAPGDATPHEVSGYDVLSLDELIVRVVRNELAALAGEPVTPPEQ